MRCLILEVKSLNEPVQQQKNVVLLACDKWARWETSVSSWLCVQISNFPELPLQEYFYSQYTFTKCPFPVK